MKASQSPYKVKDWIPTGLGNLDTILGGGIPLRRITEVSGVYSVGKSTLSLMVIAQAQKLKMPCLLADIEFAFDEGYAQVLGVDTDKLDLIQERYAETAIDEIEAWCDTHKKGLIVVDAIGGLLPREQAEKDAQSKTIGGQSKLVSVFCRKIVPLLAINNNALLVLNHQFTDIMTGKLKTSGGAKLEYHRSIWLMLRKANKRLMQGDKQVGDVIEAEIRKNKLAPTLKQTTELQMLYGMGFSREANLMEQAKEKLFEKRGQFFFIGEEKIARGEAGLREWFKLEGNSTRIKELLV